MERKDVFQDMVERTGGELYLGVVGAVRTGKSTFIKRFMEMIVIPHIGSDSVRMRTIDELPQSAAGRTIMTTEPKFVPNQAVEIAVSEGLTANIRLVDCVGYAVPGAKGYEDEHGARMVNTPWADEPIPFHEAAEIGTRRVIMEHSTMGVIITTDGSVTDLPREAYEDAEERVVHELKTVGKPFLMILNTQHPNREDTKQLRTRLEEKYEIPVMALSVAHLEEHEIMHVMREVLYEFPVSEVNVHMPGWVVALQESHWLRKHLEQHVQKTVQDIRRLRDVGRVVTNLDQDDHVETATLSSMQLGSGIAEIQINSPDHLYDQVLTEIIGEEIRGKDHLLRLMQTYSHAKREYDHFAGALEMVKSTGYGIAPPALEDMALDEPELIRSGPRYGVRLRANAPSIHMIRVDVESEFAPIIGSEKQSEELVSYLMRDFENDPLKIWESDIFGRSLHSIVREGIQAKLSMLPDHARYKLQETLGRMINEGSGGLIAIIL